MQDFFSEIYANLQQAVPQSKPQRELSMHAQKLLYEYQIPQAKHLLRIIQRYECALDSGQTGVGKTFTAAAVVVSLEKMPLIVCPKSLMMTWVNVLKKFGIAKYEIVNYETLRFGKTYVDDLFETRINADYLNVQAWDPDNPEKCEYEWHTDRNTLIIFDEAHRCKNPKSRNGKLLVAALTKSPILLLSATICESPQDCQIPLVAFQKLDKVRNYARYVREITAKYPEYAVSKRDPEYAQKRENMLVMCFRRELHDCMSGIKISDLGDMFPKNHCCAQQFVVDDRGAINNAWRKIKKLHKILQTTPASNALARIQKCKQIIEIQKASVFIEQTRLHLQDGKSVIIFVNFIATLKTLARELDVTCIIRGGQTSAERQQHIDDFQSNQTRVIICQIRAGGVGISLHDIHGNHPRVTLLNYPDSATDLVQALGRAARAGAQSHVLQRIICAANVDYETTIMENINKKLNNISAINNGDLTLTFMT